MAKAILYIKTDREVKQNVQRLAQALGLSLSDVINASLRNFIRTREVTFSAIPRMTPELERLLGRVEADIEAGKNLSPSLETQDNVERYLNTL
ncbi:MAG: hypothetical protein HY001_00475 [Candidatus Portnoybacteria bacterium]|nr:hypothetical protein [Candidatus Portnoybacteria bacterium]